MAATIHQNERNLLIISPTDNDPAMESIDNHALALKPPLASAVEEEQLSSETKSSAPPIEALSKGKLKGFKESLVKFQTFYNAKSKSEKVAPFMIDLSKSHDVQGVKDILANALTMYKGQKGVSGAIIGLSNSMGEYGQTLTDWSVILPSGEYSSLVCGCFKLVISAAINVAKVRDQIFETMSDIPKALTKANTLKDVYDESPELEAAVADLWSVVIDTCEYMLDWLSRISFRQQIKEAYKAFFKQSNYETALTKKIEELYKCAEAVNSQASTCAHVRIKNIDSNVLSIRDDVRALFTKDVLQSLSDFLSGDVFKEHTKAWQEKKARLSRMTPQKAPGPKVSQVHSVLGYDPSKHTDDMAHALRSGGLSTTAEKGRAEALLLHPRLKQFMSSSSSDLLLVEGNASNQPLVAPTSYALALLANVLGSFGDGIYVANHFCSLRRDGSAARQMMMELVCQTLQLPGCDLELAYKLCRTLRGSGGNSRVRLGSLCSLFSDLVEQLPARSFFFCLLDGVNYCEYDGDSDLRRVLSTLSDAVASAKVGCFLKVVVAFPRLSSEGVRSYFEPPERVKLPPTLGPPRRLLNTNSWLRDEKEKIKELHSKANDYDTDDSDHSSTEDDGESKTKRSKEENDDQSRFQ